MNSQGTYSPLLNFSMFSKLRTFDIYVFSSTTVATYKMENLKRTVLCVMVLFILIYDGILVAYLSLAQFDETIIRVFAYAFFILSFLANPVMLALITKYTSQLDSRQYTIRFLLFFPGCLFATNLFLALNPRVMKRLYEWVGVYDTNAVVYSVILLYIGKLCSTGVLDVFCQALIIGNNIATSSSQNTFLAKLYLGSVVFMGIFLFLVTLCCCTDLIMNYVENYSNASPLNERLIKPKVEPYTKENPEEVCSICLEDFEEAQMVASLQKCHHLFHEECLLKWLDVRQICPLCRTTE